MSTTRADGLPFLPGNTFVDPTKQRFHVSNTLKFKNGYMQTHQPTVGLGGERLYYNQISENELNELANKMPTLTYGKSKQAAPERFVPAHVAFDKKVLKFNGYFKETVNESQQEFYRVRPIDVYYYLEDDSIAIIEPKVENSGIPQGKFLKRQRLPKDDQGNNWGWKDLNVASNLVVYGKIFRLTNCDKFTQEYLESQGIVLNDAEAIPDDPYTLKRVVSPQLYVTPSIWDNRKKFLELDRKVLRFYCVWDDRNSMFGEMRPFIIHFFLVDDTIEIREVRKPNDGYDPFPALVRRQKIPKDRFAIKSSFPAIVMEVTDEEQLDWFSPLDFKIGETIFIYGRRFLIYDLDDFTKRYYRECCGVTDFTPIDVAGPAADVPKRILPSYNGFGSLEDSLQNCLTLMPKPPRKDFIQMLEFDTKTLRYEIQLISKRPEDKNRQFIMSYRLADDMLSIFERMVRNSGIIGGKFLEASKVPKPGEGDTDNPVYYNPGDFYIGAEIKIFKHRFKIVNCDARVLTLLEEHADWYPISTLDSIRTLHKNHPPLKCSDQAEVDKETS